MFFYFPNLRNSPMSQIDHRKRLGKPGYMRSTINTFKPVSGGTSNEPALQPTTNSWQPQADPPALEAQPEEAVEEVATPEEYAHDGGLQDAMENVAEPEVDSEEEVAEEAAPEEDAEDVAEEEAAEAGYDPGVESVAEDLREEAEETEE
jgi:hypothetical protein